MREVREHSIVKKLAAFLILAAAVSGPLAPEGIHEDGHHFVAQVLINREGVTGGESELYDRDRTPIYWTTLLEPYEAIVIDDRRVFHGVSAVRSEAGVRTGVRDMMLIDFFPLTP